MLAAVLSVGIGQPLGLKVTQYCHHFLFSFDAGETGVNGVVSHAHQFIIGDVTMGLYLFHVSLEVGTKMGWIV